MHNMKGEFYFMRKYLCRISVLIPMFVLYWLLTNMVNIAIVQLKLYLDYGMVKKLYFAFCFLWLTVSPFRQACCNKTWIEILFNLFPVQVLLACVFAQYHLGIFIFLCVCILVLAIGLVFEINKSIRKSSDKRRAKCRYKKAFYQILIISASLLFLIPCCMATFKYKLESPVIVLSDEMWERIYEAEQAMIEADKEKSASREQNPYLSNIGLLKCFEEGTWGDYGIEEKVTLVQKLVDFECDLFKIPHVEVSSKLLSPSVLGEYDRKKNVISIDVKYLDKATNEEVINTVAHETQHAYASYLVESLDFDSNPIYQTPYFNKVKSWKDNQEEYIDGSLGNFELYESQPLEVEARTYATDETKRIISYIEDNKNE